MNKWQSESFNSRRHLKKPYLFSFSLLNIQARLVFEVLSLIGSLFYLLFAVKESYHLGKWSFLRLMVSEELWTILQQGPKKEAIAVLGDL